MKEGIRLKRSDLVAYGVIILVIGFVLGMRSDSIIAGVGKAVGLRVETGTLDLSSVQETYQQLKANYDGDVNAEELVYGASRGVVAAANDPHTVFMDPTEVAEFDKSMKGDIVGGVGAEISDVGGDHVAASCDFFQMVSGVMGSSVSCAPMARETAWERQPGMPTMPCSPRPRNPWGPSP